MPTDPELWRVDAYQQFLAYRRDALAKAINAFIAMDDESRTVFNLEQLIGGGESDAVEFKSSARWDYREGKHSKPLESVITKTVAGFLNAKGGTLLIGVSDDGKVIGLENDYKTLGKRPDRDGYQQFLVTLISTQIGKEVCSRLRISFHPIDGEEVCVVEVAEGLAPAYVDEGNSSRLYLRTGNVTQELSTRESVEYVKTRWPG